MPKIPRMRWVVTTALALCLGAAALVWWRQQDTAPYALRESPSVTVAVRPTQSDYPEAKQVAGEVDLLIKVYVQRLLAGDAEALAALGAPWFTNKEKAAEDLIAEYQSVADKPVVATVADPVTPDLASVELRFAEGKRQTLNLSRADGVWWVEVGEGDPVKP
ncbi:hypothetical protein ACF09C_01305 [Streptomyces sp. NPDC014870]|uniref:hypothetical protein n=1 Tax=Streptomyces sp. NPDC014870 TaxID=3364925 RepID=UPI0036FC518E